MIVYDINEMITFDKCLIFCFLSVSSYLYLYGLVSLLKTSKRIDILLVKNTVA